MKSFITILISLCFYSILFSQPNSRSSCGNYAWGVWTDQGTTDTATAILTSNGQTINMLMTANYNFSFTPSIFYFNYFSGFSDNPPNTTVPKTTWAAGSGGTTTMCFSAPVQNPVLLLASIGNSSTSVSLSFSSPYTVLFNGGGNTFVNSTSLIGTEGYCILEFPGTLSCVTVFSSTPEDYTNLTWGIKIPPIVNFTYTQNCINSSVDFFGSLVNITNPLTISSWLWNFGDGTTSNLQNPTHSYTNYGNYNVQLIVTTNNNCTDTTTQTISIINPIAAFLGNDTSICQGTNVQLNAFYTGCTYLWNTGQTTQTINVTSSGTYSVKVTNSSGCIGKDTIVVNTVPIPIVNLGNDTTICQGNSLTLNAGNVGASYLWSTGAASQQINVTNSGTYWVKITNSNGCYARDTIVVNTVPVPVGNLGNDTTICKGQSVVLSGTASSQNVCTKSQLPLNLQQGLYALYPFCGNANDESGNANNGIVNGATLTTDRFGNNNSAYSFDGINDYISRAPLSDMTSLTISAWVYHTNGHNHSNILCDMNSAWGNDFYMSMTDSTVGIRADKNGAQLALATNWSGTNPPQALNNLNLENQWKHIVWVMHSAYSEIYINGVIAGTYNYTGSNVGYHNTTYFGRLYDNNYDGNFFKGKIDDIFIYNRTLSAIEVLQLYTIGGTSLSYHWSTGDSTQSITVTPSQTTNYYFTVTNSSCSAIDSVKISVFPVPLVNLGIDTTICQGNQIILNAGNLGCTYLWNTGVTTQSLNVISSGTYWVKVTNSNGCVGKDTIVVNTVPMPVVTLGNDTTICQGNQILLNAGNSGCSYLWSTGSTTQTLNIISSGTYWVKATNSIGCIGKDTIVVNTVPLPIVTLGNDTTICQGNQILLNAGNSGCNYLWNTGVTTQTLNVTSSGTYWVKVTNSNVCIGKDTIVVNIDSLPVVMLGNDTTICQGNSLMLNAGNLGASYLWSTSATNQQINVTNSGIYWVKVTNSNGCYARDTIIVNSITNLIVNLGNDTSICQGDGLLLNAGNTGSHYQWSTGLNTQTISIQSAGDYWVQVNNNNCYGSDTIHVIAIPKTIISIGNDTIMCPGDLIILTPGLGFSQYLWSDGSVLSHLNVSNPGFYSVIVFDGLCSSSDTIFIDECGSEISVPNIFTPNGDGINEFFAPVYTNIDKITLYIYNRWGNQLYEGFCKSAFWDGLYYGKLCSDGVYYYLIEYENKGKNKGMRQLHGSVTLLH